LKASLDNPSEAYAACGSPAAKRKEALVNPFPWRAKQVGLKARDLFSTAGFSGMILSVFADTIYLSGGQGEILWVSQEELPKHRRCLLASFQPRLLKAGQSFFVRGGCLQFGGGLGIDLDGAAEWKPSSIQTGNAVRLGEVSSRLRRLLNALGLLDGQEGLGRFIPLISAVVDGQSLQSLPSDSLIGRAVDPILDIARACLHQEITQAMQRGRELIGLGPGLTPSGDDFLGGFLFAVRSLKLAYPSDFFWEEQVITELIEWARPRTHSIGYAIFRDLALGHGPEQLHNLIGSLLNGAALDQVLADTTRLLRIGHSSGWDMLAGVLTGMLLIEGVDRSKIQNFEFTPTIT